MSRIFLSHSSADNLKATALRDWLLASGFDDVFLDLDPIGGIAAGERWERRLYEAANRCEAVVFLVSRSWLSSEWCLREYDLAAKLNKRIFGVLIEIIPVADLPARLTDTWQLVDLAQGEDHRPFRAVLTSGVEGHVTFSNAGLLRLKTGMTRAGLDPRFFAWPPTDDPMRSPYRGMLPLEAQDAGIFFGREAQIITALDELRGLTAAAEPRFRAILGASGAGKSSFLRAGLLPRLARDDRHFLVLPVIRPERNVISGEQNGFIRSLEAAFRSAGTPRTRADIRLAVNNGAKTVLSLLDQLAQAASSPRMNESDLVAAPTMVMSIDQAEELFLAAGQEEAQVFLALLSSLLIASRPRLIVIATIRSDSFELLQMAPSLQQTQPQPISLPPMPRGAYHAVIEGPALRLKDSQRPLVVEPALTAALLEDIETGGAKDALPLLAFTLERLFAEHGGDGDLRLVEYRSLGGIKGSIEAAVERVLRAADGDPSIPRDRNARLAILRRALIPWLAGIDPETLSPRRRVARLSEIPEEARALVDFLIAERLLATDVNPQTGERTVEPAHEALLRQWGRLQGWLEEDQAVLSSLESLLRASRDWAANDRDEAWLVHSSGRLEDAERLLERPDLSARLEPTDMIYLTASRSAETMRRDRELEETRRYAEAQKLIAEEQAKYAEAQGQIATRQKQIVKRTVTGAALATVLAVLALGFGIYASQQASLASLKEKEAVALLKRATDSESLAKQSEQDAKLSALYGLTNEFMRSRELFQSSQKGPEALSEYMTSGLRLGFSLMNNGRNDDAITYLHGLAKDLPTYVADDSNGEAATLYTPLIDTALMLAECRTHTCGAEDRASLQSTLNRLYVLLSVNERYQFEWSAEIFRSVFYLVNLQIDAGEFDAAYLNASRIEQIIAAIKIDTFDIHRLSVRSSGLASWTSILSKRYDQALRYSEIVESIVSEYHLTGFSNIRLNHAHSLLLTGKTTAAINEYSSVSRSEFIADFKIMKKAGICSPEFALLTDDIVRCDIK